MVGYGGDGTARNAPDQSLSAQAENENEDSLGAEIDTTYQEIRRMTVSYTHLTLPTNREV